MRSRQRIWSTAVSFAVILAACGSPAAAPQTKPTGPVIPRVARVINGQLTPITASGEETLPLTGAGARDRVRYTYSLTSPSSLTVQDQKGRSLLTLENVEGVGAVLFQRRQLPLLLVTSSTVGNFGFPVTAYMYSPGAGRMQAVPFSEPASPTAEYRYLKGAFTPLSGMSAATTSLLGFAKMTAGGLEVTQSVPQIATPFPSNYTLTSSWLFTEPPQSGFWILGKARFGPDSAPRGVSYPGTALGTGEQYLTALALGLPKAAAGLAAPSAQRMYSKYQGLIQAPGIGTPLPGFDESAFNATAVATGQPGALTMYVFSGSGIGLRLSAFSARIGLKKASSGLWQVTSLKLSALAVPYATPSGILGLLKTQPNAAAFLRSHKGAQISVGVESGHAFYAALGYMGAPPSFVPPTYTIDALTGSVTYAGY